MVYGTPGQKRDVKRNFWRDRICELGPWLAQAVTQTCGWNFFWLLGPIRGLVHRLCPSRNFAWHLSFIQPLMLENEMVQNSYYNWFLSNALRITRSQEKTYTELYIREYLFNPSSFKLEHSIFLIAIDIHPLLQEQHEVKKSQA